MRDLRRNQQTVYYKLRVGTDDVITPGGNYTGQKLNKYGELKEIRICVSPNRGVSGVKEFGDIEDYDKTMTIADGGCEIDENTVLWVDGADTDGPWNYTVKAVARWKNSTQYAISKVKVTLPGGAGPGFSLP